MTVTQIDTQLGLSAQWVSRALRLQRTGDLFALAALALLLPSLSQLPVPLLRAPLGLFMALYAPGYALIAALFPRRGDLDRVTRSALSLGLSAALLPILALLLDTLSWGIRPWPIVVSLSAWVILLCGVAVVRRLASAPSETDDTPSLTSLLTALEKAWEGADQSARKRVVTAGAVLAGVLLIAVVVSLLPDPAAHPTEFYVLGRDGQAQSYPREAALGDELTVTMGIANGELGRRTYRVEVWASDTWDSSRRELIAQKGPVVLAPGQTHEETVSWHMLWPGDDQRVEFLLLTDDSTQPYRRLRLQLNVLAQPSTR